MQNSYASSTRGNTTCAWQRSLLYQATASLRWPAARLTEQDAARQALVLQGMAGK